MRNKSDRSANNILHPYYLYWMALQGFNVVNKAKKKGKLLPCCRRINFSQTFMIVTYLPLDEWTFDTHTKNARHFTYERQSNLIQCDSVVKIFHNQKSIWIPSKWHVSLTFREEKRLNPVKSFSIQSSIPKSLCMNECSMQVWAHWSHIVTICALSTSFTLNIHGISRNFRHGRKTFLPQPSVNVTKVS